MSTRTINIGGLGIGGTNPVRVQSMTNTDTSDPRATLRQVRALVKAGCEIVRLSVKDESALKGFLEVQKKVAVPLVADIHFDHKLAVKCIEKGCAGIRINPGNIGGIDAVTKVINAAKKKSGVCIRIGVNSGSLEKEILKKYGHPTAQALSESCLNWVDFFEKQDFENFKISIKSSDIKTLVTANKIIASKTDAPIHIGLTEAGTLISGLVRSTLGLGELLKQGIGDTIRISLSSDPVDEVIAAYSLLKALGLRKGLEVVSCPTCARTEFDVIGIADKLEREFGSSTVPLKVAVMGCVVNGPGEAKEADLGIAGGKDSAVIFVNGEIVKKVKAKDAYKEISSLIEKRIKGENK
jgi:(E)-4-hydroxy-3-methylbut-2-enyl-diphosphate synthase